MSVIFINWNKFKDIEKIKEELNKEETLGFFIFINKSDYLDYYNNIRDVFDTIQKDLFFRKPYYDYLYGYDKESELENSVTNLIESYFYEKIIVNKIKYGF